MKKVVSVAAALFALETHSQSIVVCDSLASCREPAPPYEVAALTMETTDGGMVGMTVNFWYSHGCQGDPDIVSDISLSIPYSSIWGVNYLDPGPLPDGTEYSIIWMADDCPATDCRDGTIATDPDICQ
jgi:hypothetical protein